MGFPVGAFIRNGARTEKWLRKAFRYPFSLGPIPISAFVPLLLLNVFLDFSF